MILYNLFILITVTLQRSYVLSSESKVQDFQNKKKIMWLLRLFTFTYKSSSEVCSMTSQYNFYMRKTVLYVAMKLYVRTQSQSCCLFVYLLLFCLGFCFVLLILYLCISIICFRTRKKGQLKILFPISYNTTERILGNYNKNTHST